MEQSLITDLICEPISSAERNLCLTAKDNTLKLSLHLNIVYSKSQQ